MPLIEQVAKEENTGLINLHAALALSVALIPDHVHPNTAGAALMAKAVYKALAGQDFSGDVPAVSRSQWDGLQRLDFYVDDRPCLLIVPATPAIGKPWIWRTEFFGTEPQGDLALAARGYHVAYIDMQNMYGAPPSMVLMDHFNEHLTKNYGLSRKCVLEGFSRGGLFAFNWAARVPNQVASIYADAPVCDLKAGRAARARAMVHPTTGPGARPSTASPTSRRWPTG